MTTQSTTPNFIDPSLTAALQHWSAYSAESTRNALVVMQAITPVKDTLQVTQQVLDSMQHVDWTPLNQKVADPEVYSTAYNELTDIQIATVKKLYEGYGELLSTAKKSGQQLAEVGEGADSPQQWLAAWLEANLAIVKEYQNDISDQADSLNAIQAAYKAWFQKTIESFGIAS